MEFSAGWKPVPSVSESNPGRSLGIYNHGENCCLEDSTSHRAKHPRQSDKSVFEKKLGGGETNTDCTDITDFIRGATWYWIYYGLHLRLYGAGCLHQEIIRGNPSARQAQINPTTQKKSVKEQIRRIGFIRDCLWTWRASQRRASTSMGYCLPDSITSISFSNPETSSRVTLATLGIVFQTKLVVAHQGKA